VSGPDDSATNRGANAIKKAVFDHLAERLDRHNAEGATLESYLLHRAKQR
jgi:hypothetical protein